MRATVLYDSHHHDYVYLCALLLNNHTVATIMSTNISTLLLSPSLIERSGGWGRKAKAKMPE